MKLPIIDNQVALTSDADDLSDVFLGGVRYENSATPKVRATTVSGQYQANGLSFDATGRVFYTDATAGLPAGTTFAGGLPFSPSGALCVSSDAVSTWGNGIPFAANGAVSALFASSALTFGVTLSSVVGGLPVSGDGIVTINQVANAITPVITVSRSTGVAPLAVTFDALGTSAPAYTSLPFSEIYYAWTFGDPAGGATWAYGTNPGGNLKNEANGPVAAHVFETDGSYTVTCWAFYLDSGGVLRSGSATASITVTNADTVFSGANTICISQNSLPVQGVNGVPADAAVQQVPNWNTIQTLAQTYKRILLKRGDTWNITGAGVTLNLAGAGIIGAYGTGAKPRATLASDNAVIRMDSGCSDWRFIDLDLVGDQTTYRASGDCVLFFGATDALLLRCTFTGGRNQLSSEYGAGFYIVDCVQNASTSLGSSINSYHSRTLRMTYLGSYSNDSRGHGIRLQGTRLGVYSNNEVIKLVENTGHAFTLRGWVDNDGDYTAWGGSWTENVCVNNSVIRGPNSTFTTIHIAPQNTVSGERLRRVIFENNRVYCLGGATSRLSVVDEFTCRNNIVETLGPSGFSIHGDSSVGSPFPSQGFFYNNTTYKPNVTVGNGFTGVAYVGTVSGQVVTNNLFYAPLDTTPVFTTGSTPAQYTGSNNSTDAQIKNNRPWLAASPVAAVDFTPNGSYAVDGGTWVPVYKNYFGTTNSNPREIGAI